jgi:hypothetical protein
MRHLLRGVKHGVSHLVKCAAFHVSHLRPMCRISSECVAFECGVSHLRCSALPLLVYPDGLTCRRRDLAPRRGAVAET